MATYHEVLTAAINDLLERGYVDAAQIARWQAALREAAEASLKGVDALDAELTRQLRGLYERLVDRDGILRYHGGVDRFTFNQLKPQLRQELDKRLLAARDLIKLNREEMMARQLRRFAG